MFYLVEFVEIKNWNMFFVFFPILLIAISSETMTRNKNLQPQRAKPFSLIDFILKIIAYILSQIGCRRVMVDNIFFYYYLWL